METFLLLVVLLLLQASASVVTADVPIRLLVTTMTQLLLTMVHAAMEFALQ
jgi:hypothetical protein